jgi:hypothetical protein
LYDGSTLLATGQYVNGDVLFSGFNSTVTMDSYKIFTMKGNTNASGVISNNTSTAFALKTDSNTDFEARAGTGALLGTADISGTSGADNMFASSTNYMFHDAYPVATPASLGTVLDIGAGTKLFKFTVTNPGTRDLKLGTTTVTFNISGLLANATATGTIGDWRLYEDNGVGGLGTYLAATSTRGYAGGAYVNNAATSTGYASGDFISSGALLVDFGPSNDQNSMLDNFLISPGSSRTFIMTADTSNIGLGRGSTLGTVTVSTKVTGSTGFGTSPNWNTGNLVYYYTPIGGTETSALTHSDSYDVVGTSMTKTF